MDAAQDLMAAHGLTADRVASVEIRTFHYATRLAGHEPQTMDDLAYSIAWPVAAIIARGRLGPQELTPEALRDPEILRLSRATRLIDDPDLTARSVAQRWAAVALVLTDGQKLEAPPRTPRGDVDDPLSDGEISAKFHLLAGDILAPRAAEVEDLCGRFDRLDAVGFARLMDLVLSAPDA